MQPNKNRIYVAIDLKSFYASVECVERGLDPLTTNLVVADLSRTDRTLCLAVTPSLKSYGIAGRARLFEVNQRLREVNASRQLNAPGYRLTGSSVYDTELKAHPDWRIDYITAPPRMSLYIDYSTRIFGIYLKYVAFEDIHPYSVDEVFMDVTDYLKTYKMTARELTMTMIRDVLRQTGITATAGIGTNPYLCKVAMDIVAKHLAPDSDGVRIAELDELSYRRQLWDHKPLTSFWRIGNGIARKLELYGIDTMGKLARASIHHEALLYKLFGVNAELLIDHAWGWEPCQMKDIKAYRPATSSLSSGQVLHEAYTVPKARVVAREMADNLSLKLVDHRLLTDQIVLFVACDGGIQQRGTIHLERPTSSSRQIDGAVMQLFDRIMSPTLLVRHICIATQHLVDEAEVPPPSLPLQLELFVDYEALERQMAADEAARRKERRMQEAMLRIKRRFGKNAILRGTNFEEGATARERNLQIGGHNL